MNPAIIDIIPAQSFESLKVLFHDLSPLIAPWVQCIWSTKSGMFARPVTLDKLYPDAGSSMTFTITADKVMATFMHNTQLIDQKVHPIERVISIRFRPGGAHALLGLPVSTLANLDVSISNIAPSWLSDIDQLSELLIISDHFKQIKCVEQWLQSKVIKAHTVDYRLTNIIQDARFNIVSPIDIAGNYGMSRRTLERKLKQEMGVSPNQLFNFVRTRRARSLLSNTNKSLVDIALECGYYDQSHFSNVFFDKTLETPSQYRFRKLSQISKRI